MSIDDQIFMVVFFIVSSFAKTRDFENKYYFSFRSEWYD